MKILGSSITSGAGDCCVGGESAHSKVLICRKSGQKPRKLGQNP